MIATVIGMTYGSKNGVATVKPSTALKTEIAGVITPSPYSSDETNTPSRTIQRRELAYNGRIGVANAVSDIIPPSPRLSAWRIKMMYLTVMTMISAQTTSDRTPYTFKGETGMPWVLLKLSRSAYSGDVPMSP